jgi:hypothetical protein
MTQWTHEKGKVWQTENSPAFYRVGPHPVFSHITMREEYRKVGYQEIVYSPAQGSTPSNLLKIRIYFTTLNDSRYSLDSRRLDWESDLYFPVIELYGAIKYQSIGHSLASWAHVREISDNFIKTECLTSDESIKNIFDFIGTLEPHWYAKHGHQLLLDLQLINRPTVKKFLGLLQAKESEENAWGDIVSYHESIYEKHARLDKAITLMENLSKIYIRDKDSLSSLITALDEKVTRFKSSVSDSRADTLIEKLSDIRHQVLGGPKPRKFKRDREEVAVEDKAVQTTFFAAYQSGPSYDELRKKVEQLEDELKTAKVALFQEQKKNLDKVLEEAETQHSYTPF